MMTAPDVRDAGRSAVTVPIATHYYQFDQQGVAFNMWYLAFIEQARNGYLAAQGFSLENLLASGHDIQMVHAQVDWNTAVRYGEKLDVEVRCARVGTTSFRLQYQLAVQGEVRSVASGVYVIVDAGVQGKTPVPPGLRTALSR
jgi:acyl-CoA thioester hydrolase